jgi:hypothetical protein
LAPGFPFMQFYVRSWRNFALCVSTPMFNDSGMHIWLKYFHVDLQICKILHGGQAGSCAHGGAA